MSKKTEKKKQEKIIEDKTFGLKNKNKSKTVQSYCKGVANVVKNQGQSMSRIEQEQYEERKRKKAEAEEAALLASIYKTVDSVNQHAVEEEEEEETDPKKILCAYFKQGLCQKGRKCKYSHDMALEQKAEILDIYTDQREQIFEQDDPDNCANWDEKTLNDVIEANQKKYKSQKPTDIVCKFFLDALEKNKYGWRWVCPNGMTCHYRHCLPQGFVLKRNKPQSSNQYEESLIEDAIDEQREKLKSSGTKMTKEMFFTWKEERAKKRENDKLKTENETKKKGGVKNNNHALSGRALFQYDPTLFVDDDEAVDEAVYEDREEEQEEEDEDVKHFSEDDDDDQFKQKQPIQAIQDEEETQQDNGEQLEKHEHREEQEEESKDANENKKKKKKKNGNA